MDVIIVIGAGLAGTLSAIELAKDYKVIFIEADSAVIPGSSTSVNECFKLHTGMHYIGDKETAEHCLQKAVEFGRRFPQFIKDFESPNAPWRRGRHYIMSNSHVSVYETKMLAEHLQNLYRKLVNEDAKNQVFGSPEDFIKFLDIEQEGEIADSILFYDKNGEETQTHVVLGVETGESQIDIITLREYLQQVVNTNPNITFVPNTSVITVSHSESNLEYIVDCLNSKGENLLFQAKGLVSAAWQNNELITQQITKFKPSESCINRVKVSIKVTLPEKLQELNTCIFSSGPYASITMLGNGSAILTSERFTNLGYYLSGRAMPDELQAIIDALSLDNPQGLNLAKAILSDCASYFSPELQEAFLKAEIESIHIGYVKMVDIKETYTADSIYEPSSSIHSRRFDGVQHPGLGMVINAGMKMTYTVANAAKTAEIIKKDLLLIKIIEQIIDGVKEKINPLIVKEYQPNLIARIYQYFQSDILTYAQQINESSLPIDVAIQKLKKKVEQDYFSTHPSYSQKRQMFVSNTLKEQTSGSILEPASFQGNKVRGERSKSFS